MLGHIVLEILALGEGANTDRIAVRRDHGHGFAYVLGRRAVHDDAGPRFEAVNRHVGRDHERAAAKSGHRRLKRRQRSERRTQEQQRQNLALQRFGLRVAVEPCRELEQSLNLVIGKVCKVVECFHR